MEFKIQTEDNIREFAKRLPLLRMDNINFMFYEMLPLTGIGASIAFSRFLVLNNKIFSGVHSLINTYKKSHKDLWGNELEDCLLIRNMYFENAVEAYNKVSDYVYIILYFNFELYQKLDGKEINTKEDVVRVSKNIKGDKIEKIKKQIRNIEGTEKFLAKLVEYENSIKKIRDLANDIKHRGCIAVEGIELPRITKVTKVINGNEIDITELVSPLKLNLDVEIEKLVEVHSKTLDLQNELYILCDFQNQLKNFLNSNI